MDAIDRIFDSAIKQDPVAVLPSESPSLEELQGLLTRIASVDGAGASEAELVDHLTAMERLKAGPANRAGSGSSGAEC